ncbi:MAG: GNAT family N-acetyltransferase [archaeon]
MEFKIEYQDLEGLNEWERYSQLSSLVPSYEKQPKHYAQLVSTYCTMREESTEEDKFSIVVVEDENKVIGIALYSKEKDYFLCDFVFVEKVHRGSRVFSKLIKKILDHEKDTLLQKVRYHTWTKGPNVKESKMMERLGKKLGSREIYRFRTLNNSPEFVVFETDIDRVRELFLKH